MNPPSVPRPLQLPSLHRLAPLTVALSAALTIFASAAEPITPSELVAPKLEIVGGNLNFTVQPSVAGRTYLLQYTDTLQGGTWQNLGTAVVGNGYNLVLTAPHTAGTPRRFFRLALDAQAVAPVPEGFSLIPAGPFTMGRTSGDTDADAPPVTVTVSAFFIGKNEVTKTLWDEVRVWGAANGYTDLSIGGGKANNHPVHTVSWFDILKWCNARSQKDGLTPVYTARGTIMKTGISGPTANWTANGYRLPTEAEWEKAARGGVSGKRYPWGTDTISQRQANYYAAWTSFGNLSGDIGYHRTYDTEPFPYTSPVESFEPNGYGLYDMAGNNGEWCWDWYKATHYTDGAFDPRGAVSGSVRVIRGGNWYDLPSWSRAAARAVDSPVGTSSKTGFRLARNSAP